MEAAVMEPAVMESTMEPAVKATAGPPTCRDRGGEGEGQHSHERQTEDLLHDRLLLDRGDGCKVSPPWRLGRGSARLACLNVTLQTAPRIPLHAFCIRRLSQPGASRSGLIS